MMHMVRSLNTGRSLLNLPRRAFKGLEEVGEISEAYLTLTSPGNYKNLTWHGFKEEGVDALIVVFDLAITMTPRADDLLEAVTYRPLVDLPLDKVILPLHDAERQPLVFSQAITLLTDAFLLGVNFNEYANKRTRTLRRGFTGALAIANVDVGGDDIMTIFARKIAKWQNALDNNQSTDIS